MRKKIFAVMMSVCMFLLCVYVEPAKAAGQPLTITGFVYSTRIPHSSDIFPTPTVAPSLTPPPDYSQLVKQGKPIYEKIIRFTVTSQTNFSGQVIQITSPTSSYIRRMSSNSIVLTANRTSDGYTATFDVVYHVWNTPTFTCTASVIGSTYSGSCSVNVTETVSATYKSQFELTGYYTALESAGHGPYVAANGINDRLFRSDFLETVSSTGSGLTNDGRYIQYSSSDNLYRYVTSIATATGTVPTAGRTIATDNYYITRYYRPDGGKDRGKVYIANLGFRQAEDAGRDILGYMIDVYIGFGGPATPASWDKTRQTVTYIGNNLYPEVQ